MTHLNNIDLFEPVVNKVNKKQRLTPIEDVANVTLANDASPFDLAMAKAFVNDYPHFEKSFKGRISLFKNVVHFAAGSLLPPAQRSTVLTEYQKDLLKSVFYEFS